MTMMWEEAEKDGERTRLSLVFSFSTPGYIMFFLSFFRRPQGMIKRYDTCQAGKGRLFLVRRFVRHATTSSRSPPPFVFIVDSGSLSTTMPRHPFLPAQLLVRFAFRPYADHTACCVGGTPPSAARAVLSGP